MSTLTVLRASARDRHGDRTHQYSHEITHARVEWGGPREDTDRKTVVTIPTKIYIRHPTVDLRKGDQVKILGRSLRVIDVQPWEHVRFEGIIVGHVAICEEVT
ncbi:hypothetical protein CMUST_01220 [Corynebacterium mustelae]|uniref:Head-to-tail stopper n=1 Tax=Corynebacterium mustelae TaxID=571915 RepID=A0A0G3GYE8_9CORY|nr:hypothetical protein [Corynebacterium mustelae]AKK04593.1 hypothetical protein CMUST_01220 [Corynebacterium mustelae]